jgi:hypothetical protein
MKKLLIAAFSFIMMVNAKQPTTLSYTVNNTSDQQIALQALPTRELKHVRINSALGNDIYRQYIIEPGEQRKVTFSISGRSKKLRYLKKWGIMGIVVHMQSPSSSLIGSPRKTMWVKKKDYREDLKVIVASPSVADPRYFLSYQPA